MEPLGVSDVALLVGMVKTGGRSGNWWAMKSRVILALATFTDGDWFNAPDVERLTGIAAPLARRILLELEAQHVIVRDGGHATAPKVFWCEVNADWRRWDVEWVMGARDVELRLEYARRRWGRHPLDRLFSRPAGARSHRVIALVTARDHEHDLARQPRFIARQQGAISNRNRALSGRDNAPSRAQEVSLLTSAADAKSSSSPTPQEEEGWAHPRWVMVRAVFIRKAEGANGLYGRPKRHLGRLLATHDPDELLDAIEQAPDGLGPLLLADEVEQLLLVDPEELPEEIVPGVTPLSDAGQRHLQQLVATYRAEGAEPPESLLSDRARWQDGQEEVEEA